MQSGAHHRPRTAIPAAQGRWCGPAHHTVTLNLPYRQEEWHGVVARHHHKSDGAVRSLTTCTGRGSLKTAAWVLPTTPWVTRCGGSGRYRSCPRRGSRCNPADTVALASPYRRCKGDSVGPSTTPPHATCHTGRKRATVWQETHHHPHRPSRQVRVKAWLGSFATCPGRGRYRSCPKGGHGAIRRTPSPSHRHPGGARAMARAHPPHHGTQPAIPAGRVPRCGGKHTITLTGHPGQ